MNGGFHQKHSLGDNGDGKNSENSFNRRRTLRWLRNVRDCVRGRRTGDKDGKARLVKDSYCDGLGACLSGCPKGAVRVIEREADEFDPEEVEDTSKKSAQRNRWSLKITASGCPSAKPRSFATGPSRGAQPSAGRATTKRRNFPTGRSRLGSFPWRPVSKRCGPFGGVRLRARCIPEFPPQVRRREAVLLGCPKFDNTEEYLKNLPRFFAPRISAA